MTKIVIEIAGLEFRNPTILAAGILGMTGLTLKRVADAGAGGIITKSLGLNPRVGYTNPTVTQVEGGLLNAMGLPNPGIDYFAPEIEEIREIRIPKIISIYGSTPQEFATVAIKALNIGADGLELNVSCPHAKGLGAEIGQDPNLVEKIVEKTKRSVSIPLFVKLTPNVSNIVELAQAAETGGADGITAINTVRAMAIDIETAIPILGNKIGGLSGPAIKSIAIRCVFEIYETLKIPIIGCGGVGSWRDAVEFIQAGASAVQIGTAIAVEGIDVFKQVAKGIERFLEQKNISSVRELVGLSHRS
jgi:dihydroorotate dehydrogenase (NAD+) catalytic subunit